MSKSEDFKKAVSEAAQSVLNCTENPGDLENILSGDISCLKDYIDPELAGRWLNFKPFKPAVMAKIKDVMSIGDPFCPVDPFDVPMSPEDQMYNTIQKLEKQLEKKNDIILKLEKQLEKLKKQADNFPSGIPDNEFTRKHIGKINILIHSENEWYKKLLKYLCKHGKLTPNQLLYIR
jgi:hypothetical protein